MTPDEARIALTPSEFTVLAGAVNSSSANYQPPRDLIAAANALLNRGLIQKAVDFPAVLVATQEGWDVYREITDSMDTED